MNTPDLSIRLASLADLTAETLERQYPGAQVSLGWLDEQPVAAMLLVLEDRSVWPDDGLAGRRSGRTTRPVRRCTCTHWPSIRAGRGAG